MYIQGVPNCCSAALVTSLHYCITKEKALSQFLDKVRGGYSHFNVFTWFDALTNAGGKVLAQALIDDNLGDVTVSPGGETVHGTYLVTGWIFIPNKAFKELLVNRAEAQAKEKTALQADKYKKQQEVEKAKVAANEDAQIAFEKARVALQAAVEAMPAAPAVVQDLAMVPLPLFPAVQKQRNVGLPVRLVQPSVRPVKPRIKKLYRTY